jgi:hypothetical protein
MISYGPLPAFAATALAIAILLSVSVRRIGLSARRRKVLAGEAQADDLAELTGLRRDDLQEAFGPPDMGQVWRHVTLDDLKRARTRQGGWFAGGLFDALSLGGALIPFLLHHTFAQFALILAALLQAAAWLGTGAKNR